MSHRVFLVGLALVASLATGPTTVGELCTIDPVPAATLLLPYFEVSLVPGGMTTLFSIRNAHDEATLTHVTLWTDQSVPTLAFDVYLTGWDIQTFNVADFFNGQVPRTADAARDPNDTISPNGSPPWGGGDSSFPNCGSQLPIPPLTSLLIDHLRAAHSGGHSPIYNACAASQYGDGVLRGYLTIDVVNRCSIEFPSEPAYFIEGGQGIASNENRLLGDYFYVEPSRGYAQGENLVHIEACDPATCPFGPGDYTFYGRYVGASAADGREPLPTMFSGRALNGGVFAGGTELIVWRDSKTVATIGHRCGTNQVWWRLDQADFVALDEQENCADLCSPSLPWPNQTQFCFPLETQRVSVDSSRRPPEASPIDFPFQFGGWLLNLNTTVAGGLFNPNAQGWVTELHRAAGVYSVGFESTSLDSACTTFNGGTIWIP